MDDPNCSGFKIENVLKIDGNYLNFQDLQGTPKPLFDHNTLKISKSGFIFSENRPSQMLTLTPIYVLTDYKYYSSLLKEFEVF